VRYPRYAGAGGDGLEIVRRLMAGLPEALAPRGRCEVVGAVLGTRETPDLTGFKDMAATSNLAMIVDCRSREQLEGKTLEQLVRTSADDPEEVELAFRDHFAKLKVTHLYCYLLHVSVGPSPMLCASCADGERRDFWMVTFP